MARVVDALRRERAELIGKMLEASRIHGLEGGVDDFDLAQFIAQLRSEVLVQRSAALPSSEHIQPARAAAASGSTVAEAAGALKAQGRLGVTTQDMSALTSSTEFPGRSEETLFGFSVRELSAPDAQARIRAAERLVALRHPASAPPLATALHSEAEPAVQVALLSALAVVARSEAVPVVTPWLSSRSPEVRVAALKALLTLDSSAAVPHVSAAMKDPDKAVRRRASLLALGLSGAQALDLGSVAIADADADVRALAALVLGASNAEAARPLLTSAMRDADVRVRKAAGQSLSRFLGQDVTGLVSLDDAHRRREVRRLAQMPARPLRPIASPQQAAPSKSARVAVLTEAPERAAVVAPKPVAASTALAQSVLQALRASMRGCQLSDLVEGVGASPQVLMSLCSSLMSQGFIVRRGLKYFVA